MGYPINNLTPIEILIDILTSDKTHGGVKKIILEVIDRLLTFDGTYNDAMDVDVPALDIPLPSIPSEYEGNEMYNISIFKNTYLSHRYLIFMLLI